MVRLIDADKIPTVSWDKIEEEAFRQTIAEQPTVDAMPVIRCKDCKYYKIYKLFDRELALCNRIKTTMADPVEEDDYCSRAERKEE